MNPFAGVTIVILLVILLVLGPAAVIWALNTLFGLGIVFTFWTWLAVVVLGIYFNNGASVKK